MGSYTPSPGISVAFLYQNKTTQTLQILGAIITAATGVNATGEVVGFYYDANYIAHGFKWTPPADVVKK